MHPKIRLKYSIKVLLIIKLHPLNIHIHVTVNISPTTEHSPGQRHDLEHEYDDDFESDDEGKTYNMMKIV